MTEVSEKFIDKRFVDDSNLVFLNRLENMNLSFDKSLDTNLKRISKQVIDTMKLNEAIIKYKNINYSLKDLIINCKDEEIQALIYYFQKELKKNDNEVNEDPSDKKFKYQKKK